MVPSGKGGVGGQGRSRAEVGLGQWRVELPQTAVTGVDLQYKEGCRLLTHGRVQTILSGLRLTGEQLHPVDTAYRNPYFANLWHRSSQTNLPLGLGGRHSIAPTPAGVKQENVMTDLIVDTHAHIYDDDEIRYPKIDEPYRPGPGIGDATHLLRVRHAHGIHKVVLVQTGSAYKWDNRLLADRARGLQDWTTGVCNLDPEGPESVVAFTRLVAEDNVSALRLEATADGHYDHEGSRRLLATAREIGAVICAHLQARYLNELDQLLTAFPELPVVLDHCAYPEGAAGPDSDTVRAVTALAKHPSLYAKLTFLVTKSEQPWPFADTQAIARRVLDAFGPERCMRGLIFPASCGSKTGQPTASTWR